jgi:hypothetical protein
MFEALDIINEVQCIGCTVQLRGTLLRYMRCNSSFRFGGFSAPCAGGAACGERQTVCMTCSHLHGALRNVALFISSEDGGR